jgi:uncharacterized protein YndB with AHSA1/START domain
MAGKVHFHRVMTAPPERIFRAFSTPEALAKWLPPHGFSAKMHTFEFKVGGGYKMSFHNLTTGSSHSFNAKYTEIKENQSLKYLNIFDNPHMPGEMLTTVQLKKVMCGTELTITQEGIPDMIPVEMCTLGWQQSLELLTQLVTPEIPDQG